MVWSKGKTLSGKRLICKKIATFVLKEKLRLFKNRFIYIADEVEELLKLQKVTIFSKFLFMKICKKFVKKNI